MATYDSNTVLKFADNTTVVGLISGDNESAYREEVSDLAVWCQSSNLTLNISKTNELIVDYRNLGGEHTPIHIDRAAVGQVESFKFLDVQITKDLKWSTSRLKWISMDPRILKKFYSCTIESILTGCITAWYGNSTAFDRMALQRVVRTAQYINGAELPAIQDLYTRWCQRKAWKIV